MNLYFADVNREDKKGLPTAERVANAIRSSVRAVADGEDILFTTVADATNRVEDALKSGFLEALADGETIKVFRITVEEV